MKTITSRLAKFSRMHALTVQTILDGEKHSRTAGLAALATYPVLMPLTFVVVVVFGR